MLVKLPTCSRLKALILLLFTLHGELSGMDDICFIVKKKKKGKGVGVKY